ncbi:hypothetical protein BC827DRAFT_1340090 [Russula dissimulans]|nr:hypothetical protein BC827DRAFT_1340090 [Russula dissimulans]
MQFHQLSGVPNSVLIPRQSAITPFPFPKRYADREDAPQRRAKRQSKPQTAVDPRRRPAKPPAASQPARRRRPRVVPPRRPSTHTRASDRGTSRIARSRGGTAARTRTAPGP